MPHNLRYYAETVSLRGGGVVRVEILEEDWVGGSTEVNFVQDAVLIQTSGPNNRDVYIPRITTQAELALMDDEDGSIAASFDDVTDTSHLVKIYHPDFTSPAWVGYVLPEPIEATLDAFPDSVIIQAVDGLALLKQIPFLDDGDEWYEGQLSIVQVILACLNKLNLGLDTFFACEWWTPALSANPIGESLQPLDYYLIDAATFVGENDLPISCHDVLEQCLTAFHLQLYQSPDSAVDRATWHCIQRDLLFSGSYHRHLYQPDRTLAYQDDYNPAIVATLDEALADRTSGGRAPKLPGYQAAQIAHEYGDLPSIIINPSFYGEEKAGRRRGGIDPDSRRGGSNNRSGVRNRGGGGPRGRGGVGRNRGFAGRGTRLTVEEAKVIGWKNSLDGSDILSSDVEAGVGPSSENAYAFGSHTAAITAPVQLDPFVAVDDFDHIYSVGRVVRGGTGKVLRLEVSTKVVVPRADDIEAFPPSYPVYFALKLEKLYDGGSTVKWLNQASELQDNFFGVAVDSARLQLDGGPTIAVGTVSNAWITKNVTFELPDGFWRPTIYLYPAFDVYFKGDQSVSKHYWTNIFLDFFSGDIRPQSEVVTATYAAGGNNLFTGISTVIGDAPFADLYGSLYAASVPTQDWRLGRYDAEPATGYSLARIVAEYMLREQAETLPVHDAGYVKALGIVWLSRLLEIAGTRYQPGNMTYDLVGSPQQGQFFKVARSGVSPTYDILNEDGSFASLGGFDGSSFFGVQLSNDLFNRALQSPVMKTDQVISAGLVTEFLVSDITTSLEAGDQVLMLTPLGRSYQFTVTQNISEGSTGTLFIDDDARLGNGFLFDEPVDYPAGIFVRNGYLRSIISQTPNAFSVLLQSGEICRLTETITNAEKTSLAVTPLRLDVKQGMLLEILDQSQAEPQEIVVSADTDAGSEVLPIESQVLTAASGTSIRPSIAQFLAEFLITPDRIVQTVTETRQAGAIASLSADVEGASKTSLPVTATTAVIKAGAALELISPLGNVQKVVTVSSNVALSATSIPINTANFTEEMPEGSTVRLASYYASGQIKLQSDEIDLRLRTANALTTWSDTARGMLLATIQSGSSGSTLSVSSLSYGIKSGTTITILVDRSNYETVPVGESLFEAHVRTTTADRSVGATTIPISSSLTVYDGDLVVLGTGGLESRFVVSETAITLQDGKITNLVAQYQDQKVASLNASYSGSRTSIAITGLTRNVLVGDQFLIYRESTSSWIRVTASVALTATGGSQTLQINTQTVIADSGDPILAGTMSQLTQELGGFTVAAKYFKTDNYNGTIDASGNITAGASAGWAWTDQGHFNVAQDANNYLIYNASGLVISAGNGKLNIDDTGLSIVVDTSLLAQNKIRFVDGTTVFELDSQDTGSTNLYASRLHAAQGELIISADDTSDPNNRTGWLTAQAVKIILDPGALGLELDGDVKMTGTKIGFYNTTPGTKPTITGSAGSNVALLSLLNALDNLGLITDSSS